MTWKGAGWLVIVAALVTAAVVPAGEPEIGSRPAVIEQKLRLVDRLLAKAGPEDSAVAKAALAKARQAVAAGDLDRAEQFALQAQRGAMSAYRASSDDRAAERGQDRFNRRRAEVESFASAYRAMLAEEGSSAAAREDEAAAAELMRRADARAQASDFASGEALLTAAYERVVLGFKREKDRQTVEYRLTFANPEEEYRYEVRRYGTYELLLERRLDGGEVSGGDRAALDETRAGAERLAAEAAGAAQRGDFTAALRLHERATDQLIVALRRSGMMLP